MNPDQQNPERVRGFPVEIDVEEGENDAGENIFDDDDDFESGAVLLFRFGGKGMSSGSCNPVLRG